MGIGEMGNKFLHMLFGVFILSGMSQAQALTINFSDISSDLTDPSLLSATMVLEVTNTGGNDLLNMTITNLSNDFKLAEAFINFTGDNSLLTLDTVPAGFSSTLSFDTTADGFGTFDIMLDLDSMNNGLAINQSETWIIDLGVTGVTTEDFNLLSGPPGNKQQLAALKFTQGPCDPEVVGACVEDSAYGGGSVVPVPAAVWLFGSGLLGLVGVARRKHA